jgi:hypothetical protein
MEPAFADSIALTRYREVVNRIVEKWNKGMNDPNDNKRAAMCAITPLFW